MPYCTRCRMALLLGFFVFQSIYFGCRPSNTRPPDGSQESLAQTVDSLLMAADSLPLEAVEARLTLLPQAFQDSFFTKRLLVLETAENDAAIKQTLQLFKKIRPGDALAESLEHFYFGIFSQYAGKFDSAEIRYTQATQGFEKLGAKYFLAQCLDKHSGNLTTRGRSDEAIGMKYQAIGLLKGLGETKAAMKVQTHLANVFNLKGDSERAIALLEEPLVYYAAQKDTINLAYMLAIKGTAFLTKKDLPNALLFHKQALNLRQRVKAVSGITESLFHVGRVLGRMALWQESLDTLRVAEKVIQKGADKQGQAYIDAGIGEALFNLGRFEEAETYLANSLALSIKRKQYPSAQLAASRLSIARKQQRRFEEALQFHEQFVAFKDSVSSQERDKLSRELTIKYETREKELQIHALQRENELATQRNWWIGGLLLLLSSIGFYAFRLSAAREHQRLQAEKAQSEAQSQVLAQQLEIKNIELAANRSRLEDYAQMLIERNQQLHELTQEMELGKTVRSQKPPEGSEALFKQVILTEADWAKFKEYFNKVYPGYIAQLRVQQPDLTPAEIRLVLLDKMGLSLKECSSILGISIDAVKKGRYRLKKKLNLESDDLSGII